MRLQHICTGTAAMRQLLAVAAEIATQLNALPSTFAAYIFAVAAYQQHCIITILLPFRLHTTLLLLALLLLLVVQLPGRYTDFCFSSSSSTCYCTMAA
jgi:hypothetical protein